MSLKFGLIVMLMVVEWLFEVLDRLRLPCLYDGLSSKAALFLISSGTNEMLMNKYGLLFYVSVTVDHLRASV